MSRASRRLSGGRRTATSAPLPAPSAPKVITGPNTASVAMPIAKFPQTPNTCSFTTITASRRRCFAGAPIIAAHARVSIRPSRSRSRENDTGCTSVVLVRSVTG